MITPRNILYSVLMPIVIICVSRVRVYSQELSDSTFLVNEFPFINIEANHIELNGADWSRLVSALDNSDRRLVNIVHIGDSHIQADIATTTVRHNLQDVFGSAGRGLVVPHRLTGSNEALDYTFKTNSRFECSRLIGRGDKTNVGFTGVGLSTKNEKFDLEISAAEPFERVKVFFNGSALTLSSVEGDDKPVVVTAMFDTPGCLVVDLPFACNKIGLNFSALGPVTIFGAEIISDIVGVAYHTIGVNGATFSSYLKISDFGECIAVLHPDLIVVSLGTNDGLGRFSADDFKTNISLLCDEISRSNPHIPILLLTPSEIQRRVRKRGKRRVGYTICPNIEKVGGIIKSYARDNNVAVYDWYSVSGGAGASKKWLSKGLLSRDRVHDTKIGYQLAGELFSKALLEISAPTIIEEQSYVGDSLDE